MANDVNSKLRAELEAAGRVLEPQIRGLHDLLAVSISAELRAEVATQIEIRERRRNLLASALVRLDDANAAVAALERDGYPSIEDTKLSANLLEELQTEESDLETAIKLFTPDSASAVSVNLGNPVEKPQNRR
jgi:hypothetical protein